MTAHPLDPLDRALIDRLQDGIPLCDEPFATIGTELGCPAAEVIARIEALLEAGVLSRFGPLFNADHMGGSNLLAAMSVPTERFETVAAEANAHPEVAHNYAREHALNMWFVVAADSPEAVEAAITAIEAQTGLPVFRFPKQREFFVDLRLPA